MKFNQFIKKVRFSQQGLVPVIIQDAKTDKVLMLAYMNRQALRKTIETGRTCFFSRSRKKLWIKGETSGHIQRVQGIFLDCDGDTLLVKVRQKGAACHTGYSSCFYRQLNRKGTSLKIIGRKAFNPKKVYHR
jgi:phosphoribosyl-AMP cyclohydrolase